MNDNMERLTRSFNMLENSMEKMWDMWRVGLGGLSWTQDQIENLTRQQLDRNKAVREEMVKMMEDLTQQMRKNQEQFQKLIEESVMNAYEQVNYVNKSLAGQLNKENNPETKSDKK